MRRHPATYDLTEERNGKTYRLPVDRVTYICTRCGQHAFAKVHMPPPVWPVYLICIAALVVAILILMAVIPS